MVNLFGGGGQQQTSTPANKGGELLGGEDLGEGEGTHLPWERRGRRHMSVTLDSREAPPQVEQHTLVTRQPAPETLALPAFSSSNSGSDHDDGAPTQHTTSTGEENQLLIHTQHRQLSGKYEEEIKRYAKEVDDLKLALHAKETELQKVSDLRKDHASLQEEVINSKKSFAEAEAALERVVGEAKVLSEREKVAAHKAKEAEEARIKTVEERDEIKSKLVELETTQHQATVVLQGEIDCLKLKVGSLLMYVYVCHLGISFMLPLFDSHYHWHEAARQDSLMYVYFSLLVM